VVGRGGRDYWTDLKLDTLPDVSREHCRLRRDATTGQFFLTDVSSLGTTIDGAKAAPQQETPLPARARIGLAGVVYLEFRSTPNG
jgi:predicted component of type VI protein secretion system